MEIDDSQLFDFMQDTSNKLGQVLQSQQNLHQYIEAVSDNNKELRKDFATHKDSTDAHGLGSERKTTSSVAVWVAVLVSVSGLLFNVFKAFGK